MKAIAVIPARLASTRLPRKMLREIAGKPLVGVVYEAVRSSSLLADVIVATDSEEILGVCRDHGWKALMTSPAHRSGTERVHEMSAGRRPTSTSMCKATNRLLVPSRSPACCASWRIHLRRWGR